MKKKSAQVTEGHPPPSPYPGRATPAHPQSRVSAKARALYRVSAKALCRDSAEALESLLKLCSFCAHTPDRRIFSGFLFFFNCFY